MSLGNEYLTSNVHIAFPFKENAEALGSEAVHGSVATATHALLVDAVIFVVDSVKTAYLDRIVDLGAGIYALVFADQDGNEIISASVNTADWSAEHYQYGTWDNPTLPCIVKLVFETAGFMDYVSGIVGQDIFQQRLPMESTTVNIKSPTVDTLELYEELPDPPEPYVPGPIDGRVKLIGGYNTTIGTGDDDEPDTAVVELAMTPLSGAGLVPCEETAAESYRGLQELIPDANGNIQFVTGSEKCYSVIPHPALGILELHSSCKACCSCEDYESVALAIRNLLLRSSTIYSTLNHAHGVYTTGVTHYNNFIAPIYTTPALKVNGMGGAYWGGDPAVRSGATEWLTLTMAIKNNSRNSLKLNTLQSNIQPPVYTVRQLAWEYAGNGDQIDEVSLLDISLDDLPMIARGAQMTIYALLYVGFPADPLWFGQITVNCQEIDGPTWALVDSFEVT